MVEQRHKTGFLFVLFLLTTLVGARQVHAHGSMEIPVSRVLNCYQEGPENPRSAACRAAVAVGGTQAFYDWNGVNRLDANGRHQEIIPDGKLCSAGKDLDKGLDLARSDWPAQTPAPDPNGNFRFVFRATAPHATQYFQFYITRDGYNPLQPLRWTDLEAAPFCTITNVALTNGRYELNCPLPHGKTGKHVIYNIWQRSDSTEAFYSCIDVQFGGAPPPPTPWRELGRVRAQQDLPVGSMVTFRLFDSAGRDVESRSITLQQGMTTASGWPFFLAQAVNAASQLVNIGVLGTDGVITPQRSSQANSVFVRSLAAFTFTIDIETSPPPPPSGPVEFNYPTGRGRYTAGTIVRGTDGNIYKCRPFPNSGWCNGSDFYYAPGTGLAWEDAWIRLQP